MVQLRSLTGSPGAGAVTSLAAQPCSLFSAAGGHLGSDRALATTHVQQALQLPALTAPLPACGGMQLRHEHMQPGYHCHPAALDATLHLALFGEHGAGTSKAPKVPVAAACFSAPSQGVGTSACFPVMLCEQSSSAKTAASYALLSGPGDSPFRLTTLQSKKVGSAMAVQQPAAVPSLPSYIVRRAVHGTASRGGCQLAGHASTCSVSLAGGSCSVSLLDEAAAAGGVTAAVQQGAQVALRYLQQVQQPAGTRDLRLTASTDAALPVPAPCGSWRDDRAGVLVTVVQSMLKAAAVEPSWQAPLPSFVSSDCLEPAIDAAAAPGAGSDVFSALHAWRGSWLLSHLERSSPVLALEQSQPDSPSGPVAISGGLGSLGLLVAAWIAASRRPVALWGRCASGQLPAALVAGSSLVRAVQCDVACTADVANAADWQRNCSSFVHTGGVLLDALLPKQTAAGLRAALAPKLCGCLTAASAQGAQPLQQLLLFSSVAALLGNAGQVNYAAANAALDATAVRLQHQGTGAASLQWGPWAGGGMASPAVVASLAARGVGLVQPGKALLLLRSVMARCAGGSRTAVVAPLVALRWQRMLRPAQQRSQFFADVAADVAAGVAALPAAWRPVAASAPRLSVREVEAAVLEVAAGVLGSTLSLSSTFMAAGLDSLGELPARALPACLRVRPPPPSLPAAALSSAAHLVQGATARAAGAVELRNAVANRFSVDLSATATFDYPTPAALATHVCSQLATAAVVGVDTGPAHVSDGWDSQTAISRLRGLRGPRLGAGGASAPRSDGLAAVQQKLAGIAAGVVGRAVGADQPLMEVRARC